MQPSAGSTHSCITVQAVERARFSQSVKNAPGPDTLSYRSIRLLLKWNKYRILLLTRAAIRTGRHAVVSKRASRVVFRKRGKDDYMKVKVHRSISLLRCVGIVIKKVVAEPLPEVAERTELLRDRQFRSRKR
jgi:hypothetical protein